MQKFKSNDRIVLKKHMDRPLDKFESIYRVVDGWILRLPWVHDMARRRSSVSDRRRRAKKSQSMIKLVEKPNSLIT